MPTLLKVLDKAIDPTAMDDATATKLGLKVYSHGTTYNGGIAPTVTLSTTLSVVVASRFMPYQMQDGVWRMKVQLRATSVTSTTQHNITINGITYSTVASNGFHQTLYFSNQTSNGVTDTVVMGNHTTPNTAVFGIKGSTNFNEFSCAGDFELASKPTWAY